MLAKAFRPEATMVGRLFLCMLGAAVCLSACDRPIDTRAEQRAVSPVAPVDIAPSPASLELADYYATVESGHRKRGLLRLDGGGPDTPYDADALAQTFRSTAFAREFTDQGAALVQRESASQLHRWEQPIRIETRFGQMVSDAQRAEDSASIARYAERLGRVTQHPISMVDTGGNFHVMVLAEDERRIVGPTLTRLIPGIRPREIEVIENLDRSTYCIVVASAPRNDGAISRAVAVIRAELPPILRLACIHEEIAQGLGLANDSETARPSIFNDDDEFGRLTTMDEKMLRMLYDIRLKPGQDADSAAPVVASLARALTGQAF